MTCCSCVGCDGDIYGQILQYKITMDTNLDDNANPSVEPEIIDANDGSRTLVAVDDQQITNKEIVNIKPTTQSTYLLRSSHPTCKITSSQDRRSFSSTQR